LSLPKRFSPPFPKIIPLSRRTRTTYQTDYPPSLSQSLGAPTTTLPPLNQLLTQLLHAQLPPTTRTPYVYPGGGAFGGRADLSLTSMKDEGLQPRRVDPTRGGGGRRRLRGGGRGGELRPMPFAEVDGGLGVEHEGEVAATTDPADNRSCRPGRSALGRRSDQGARARAAAQGPPHRPIPDRAATDGTRGASGGHGSTLRRPTRVAGRRCVIRRGEGVEWRDMHGGVGQFLRAGAVAQGSMKGPAGQCRVSWLEGEVMVGPPARLLETRMGTGRGPARRWVAHPSAVSTR